MSKISYQYSSAIIPVSEGYVKTLVEKYKVPNEKITWGKLSTTTPRYIVESDATIVAPLMFAWILGW